jgi:hypothetical protein
MAKRKAAPEGAEQPLAKQQKQQKPKRLPQQASKAADDDNAQAPDLPATTALQAGGWKNKEKVLLLSSRGITYRCAQNHVVKLAPAERRHARCTCAARRLAAAPVLPC